MGAMERRQALRRGGGARPIVDAPLKGREGAPLPGQLGRHPVRLLADEGHKPSGEGQPLLGVVGDAQADEHIGPPHDPQANLAGELRHPLDLGDGVVVGVDNVVQEADGQADGLPQALPVHLGPLGGVAEELHQVDGAQVAGLIGQEGLLPAGVGGHDPPQVGGGVVLVDAVHEEHAGLAVQPRPFHNLLKHLPGVQTPGLLARAGVNEVILLPPLHPLHEVGVHPHGDVEVVDLPLLPLTGDELQDIGVAHVHDRHVGPVPLAPLGDQLGDGGEVTEDSHGAARLAVGGGDGRPLGADLGEGEAGPPAELLHHGGVFGRLHNALHGVLQADDETGGQGAGPGAGVHQGGGVGEELQARHHPVKGVL